jgi:hypothetical protein
MRAAPPVVAELTSPTPLRFVQGAARVTLGHLAGRLQRHTAYSRFYDWPASAQSLEWLVEVPEELPLSLTVRVACPRAGAATATIHLLSSTSIQIEPAQVAAGRSKKVQP